MIGSGMEDAILLSNISRPHRLTQLSNATQTASRTLAENSRSVLPVQMLLGRWGLPDHAEIAALPLRRLAGAIAPTGGNSYLIEARWYPMYLLLYAGCIGAISGTNYEVLHNLLHAAVPSRDGRQNRDILLISVMKAMCVFGKAAYFGGTDLIPGGFATTASG
jgi:hypothetical protein